LETTAAAPGRIARNTSIVTRLSLVIVLVALISLVVTSVVGLQRGSELADGILRDRLVTVGAARAVQVEQYVASLQRTVRSQTLSVSTAEAIEQFADAYRELQAAGTTPEDDEAVGTYYTDVVAPELTEVRGRPVSAASLVPRAAAAVHLQANYVVPSAGGDGFLDDAGDGSRWSELHTALHESFDEIAVQTGIDDLYLIEPTSNVVVYSTAKDIDFATSLLTGPQSGTALAVLINSFPNRPEPGSTAIADFTSYPAAGDEPSLFVAGPVIADGVLAGFVAVRVGPDELGSITTNDGSWPELGDTGESYVVANDDLMRSNARGFIEDEGAYLEAAAATGTATEDQIRSMETFGTTVLFQPVDSLQVDAALSGEPTVVETTNYRGTEVVSSRRALAIEGLDWAVFAEAELQEIEEPVEDFVRNLLVAIAVFIVVITFLAVRWSNRLLEPLRVISNKLRAVRSGDEDDAGTLAIPDGSPTEFAELGLDIDTMLETLTARRADAEERASERRDLLRRILPPPVAQRAEAGDRDVIDQVATASVAVIVIRGLGSLMQTGSSDDARDLLDRFVQEADALAKQRGLDRVRITGDAYFAACGTARPHLDHASRAVSFALEVRDLLRDLAEADGAISMSAGVESGPVTVGLTGGSRLVYDAWGSTVQNAANLARRAGSSEVLVSAAVRSQLPSSYVTEDYAGPTESAGVVIVSGRTTEEAPVS
jgi:class 3 adenylate cyclase